MNGISFVVKTKTRTKTPSSEQNMKHQTIAEYNFVSFVLLRDYFNSFNFFRNSKHPRNQIGRCGVQVKKENDKNHRHVLTFSTKPHSPVVLQRTAKKCTKSLKCVERLFCSLNLLFCCVVVA